jgi:hypothetical protein
VVAAAVMFQADFLGWNLGVVTHSLVVAALPTTTSGVVLACWGPSATAHRRHN